MAGSVCVHARVCAPVYGRWGRGYDLDSRGEDGREMCSRGRHLGELGTRKKGLQDMGKMFRLLSAKTKHLLLDLLPW